MLTTPIILIGKNVSFTVSPATIAAGVITVGTAVALAGKATRAAKRHRRRTFEAMPLDANIVNNVPFVDDWVVELSGIKRGATGATPIAGPNPLDDVFFQGSGFAQIVITTPTNIDTYAGILVNYDWEAMQQENIESIVLIPIDTGAANPTRS